MKNNYRLSIIFCIGLVFCSFFTLNAQSVTGKWIVNNEKTDKPDCIVEIFIQNNKLYGKIVKIFDPKAQNAVCSKCEGSDKNKPVLGIFLIRDLVKNGDEYSGGKILDPRNGKKYSCKLELKNSNQLKVRGYIGSPLLGQTMIWNRTN